MTDIPPAGPERDAAIALALGWCKCESCSDIRCYLYPDNRTFGYPPEWSTDRHAASDLLFEMQERGYGVEVFLPPQGQWTVAFGHRNGVKHGWTATAFADTVSAACLWALWGRAGSDSIANNDG